MNTNFKVIGIGLTLLAIKPESTAAETDAFTIRPSELRNFLYCDDGAEISDAAVYDVRRMRLLP